MPYIVLFAAYRSTFSGKYSRKDEAIAAAQCFAFKYGFAWVKDSATGEIVWKKER